MTKTEPAPGTLYVVATPIGNLEDVTLRALKVLGGADWIAAEDTRRGRILLERHKIKTRLVSFGGDMEERKTPELLERLAAGESGALISDAGTPGASDPGARLVAAAAAAGIPVCPIPGASAVAAAFSVSGLESPRFVFEGFLPRSGEKRRRALTALKNEERAAIVFESANRMPATMADLFSELGDRRLSIMREMTKFNEEIIRTTLGEAAGGAVKLNPKGEYTIVIDGARERDASAVDDDGGERLPRLLRILAGAGMSARDAAKAASEFLEVPRNKAYAEATRLNQSPEPEREED
ncbi:MAG TPA: 16S rRNA (cytidine(1402)-2'-O)-methyltransferase [bacterium]|nr:16S rRNA (cytidine(1402)-2'-O)-methyltransferase [bacterium]